MTDIFEGRGNPQFRPWYQKRTDPSHEAPDDESGALLPVRMHLLASPIASIVLGNLIAYSTGLEFMLGIRYDRAVLDPMGGCGHYYQDDDPDRCLRIGLQLGDGTRVTSLDYLRRGDEESPPTWELTQTWGGGGGDTFQKRWWLWPLPPPGPVLFVLEWPAATGERITARLDGEAIRLAASQSIRFWEDPQT